MQLKSIFSFGLHSCPVKVYFMITALRKKIPGLFRVEWLIQNRLASDGNSLAVQCLGLCTFTPKDPGVQSLVRELKSCKPCGAAKKKKNRDSEISIYF